MNRIDRAFRQLAGRKAILPFVCAGYPTVESLPEVLLALEAAGAPVVEVGIPFSDPIADGPVIAAAMHEALAGGITPERVFAQVEAVRARLGLGLVAMVSMSIVHRLGGASGFVARAVAAGFDGFIVPDAPLEESEEIRRAARANGATLSLLVAPSTPMDRAGAIAAASTGFVYLLARSGVTGERASVPDIGPGVRALRAATSLPIACGFGVSTAEQVREVVRHADAAIVGSALVKRMGRESEAARAAGDFVGELSLGLRN